jgi:hypothetical protein
MSEKPDPVKTRRMLALLAAVCLFPFVGAALLYFFWAPTSSTNYGELLEVVPLESVTLADREGRPLPIASLRGRWAFVMTDSGQCEATCRSKLHLMRQVRLALGKDQDRIERLWLIEDKLVPATGLLEEFAGTREVRASAGGLRLPAAESARDHVYLIDPFGNLMMRFPRNADLTLVKKDMVKLMKISSGWIHTGGQDKSAP